MPTKEDRKIEDLGIYELRVLARNVGVKSPTSKKRDELLTAIKDILEGKVEPYSRKDGRGRPTKMIATLDEFSSVLVPSDLNYDIQNSNEEYCFTNDLDTNLVLMQKYAGYDDEQTQEISKVEGIIDTNRMGVAILRVKSYDYSNEDVFISNHFMENGALVEGDYIVGQAALPTGQKTRALVSIEMLNGKTYDNFERCHPTVLSQPSVKKYQIKNSQVVVGKRTLWLYSGRQNLNEKAIEIYQNLQEKKIHVFNLNLNNLDCDAMFETDFYHYVPVAFVKETSSMYLATKLTFERANVLARQGEEVLILFSAISSYLKTAFTAGTEQTDKIDYVVKTLKEYLSYSKMYDNGGSITILCLDNETLPAGLKNLLEYEVLDIFHEIHTKKI